MTRGPASALRALGCDIVVAVVGQPNVGKSTLFNALTGRKERVGNFPGTTVDVVVGKRRFGSRCLCFVDLPGVYGLVPSTMEERITRDFIIFGDWDLLLVLVDATAVKEGARLLLQVLQLTSRVVVALTKYDALRGYGASVDVAELEKRLGVPVVPVSAITGWGLLELLSKVVEVASEKAQGPALRVKYPELEAKFSDVVKLVEGAPINAHVDPRGVAVLILMGDRELFNRLSKGHNVSTATIDIGEDEGVALAVESALRHHIRDIEPVIRMGERLRRKGSILLKLFVNPFMGVPLSLLIMFASLIAAFAVSTGSPITEMLYSLGFTDAARVLEEYSISSLIERAVESLKGVVEGWSEGAVADFVTNGLLNGVGWVLSFLPVVFAVLAITAAIEDSGLGPLMAISFNNMFRRFGLSGRAVYPLLVCVGCNVPGVMLSRTALDPWERLEVVAAASFIPCSARLVVLLFLVGLIFKGSPLLQVSAVVLVYAGGIFLYLITALLVRKRYGVREPPALILELPRVQRPHGKIVIWNSWALTKHFLVRVGTLLIALSIIMWALSRMGPGGLVDNIGESYAAQLGHAMGTLLAPLYGLPEGSAWAVGLAVLTGFIAKENLIATLIILAGSESPLEALGIGTAQGLALLAFFMYYVPCLATSVTIYTESRSLRFTLAVVAYTLVLSLLISLGVYHASSLLFSGG